MKTCSWKWNAVLHTDTHPYSLYINSKDNISNVNCARTIPFIFDQQTDVLLKVSKFWERKSFDLKGNRTPNLCFHADCSNQLRYQGWTFAASCFLFNTGSAGADVSVVNLKYETLALHEQHHLISTHEQTFLCVEVCETENVSTWRGLEPQPSESWRMPKPFDLSGPDFCCPMFLILALQWRLYESVHQPAWHWPIKPECCQNHKS